jgi:hypothetical protein
MGGMMSDGRSTAEQARHQSAPIETCGEENLRMEEFNERTGQSKSLIQKLGSGFF